MLDSQLDKLPFELLDELLDALYDKKYRKAEYVQRCVPSSNVQVLFIF